ncbi:30S ribosomal protein S15 [endosymbiont of Pachyrhynchus infernalis]|uniref:30S ribosomal protein S15 n=1 Tax=endosymbiont of Pachyrhynchus infernalis TaxID=1971488 RepID=UPI000DC7022F|nr:30S ribosomal protein S15 [endosymbiont of Pachyrhynchus infernalis]BBA84957.1 30S ribosomal protein S15 [endosymbiont of Pachyrhynchus infernalis]
MDICLKYNSYCGSIEFQITNLTNKINKLQEHFKINKKDNHSKRGLILMISKRKKLLSYLKRKNTNSYINLISNLNLRK